MSRFSNLINEFGNFVVSRFTHLSTNSPLGCFLIGAALAGALSTGGMKSAHAATFTVSNTNDSGAGSLRQAIISANATIDTDTIVFNISGNGVHTIAPLSSYPAIVRPLVLDGGSQPGFQGAPLVELSGANVAQNGFGLLLGTSNCIVRAITVNAWKTAGIGITGTGTTGCHIEGSLIGLNSGAASAVPNEIGVFIGNGAHGNFVGGTTNATANYIAGNATGVAITADGSDANFVIGNVIGTDGSGKKAVPNSFGILISQGAKNNTVGGKTTPVRNLISGNRQAGVAIEGSTTTGNIVLGNVIGMSPDGTGPVPNQIGIVLTAGASGNIIGAGNGGSNVISGNKLSNVALTAAIGNTITNNIIGPDASMSAGTGSLAGVALDSGSHDNTVGPSNVVSGNVIGVSIAGDGTTNNTVIGNNIGTNASGASDVANSSGVVLGRGAQGNTIGGITGEARNLISGNGVGISIQGANTSGNDVQGNIIGTNGTGDAALPNGVGISISEGASFNAIGASISGALNLISGNTGSGIVISGDGTNNNVVQGNIIGANGFTNAGTTAIPNGNGIIVDGGARNTLIGGIEAGVTNIISGNHGAGVAVRGASSGTRIQHNFIGAGHGGTGSIPNSLGVVIEGNSQFTSVGADKTLTDHAQISSESNLIANNPVGIVVKGVLSYNNTIRANVMSGNGSAIDLNGDGPTMNDDKDGDDGPNRLQNAPLISSVARNADDTGNRIVGTLNSAPSESFLIDIYFKNDGATSNVDSYVGNLPVTTDSDGNASFDITSSDPNTYDATHYLVTATRAGTGDTSEFSPSITSPPNVTIGAPLSGERLRGFTSVSGTASSSSGIAHVDLYIIRLSDGKFWDGTAWGGGGSAILPTSYNASTQTWTSTGTFPAIGGSDPNTSFTSGDYDIIAQAYDSNGQMSRTDSIVTIEYHSKYTYTGRAATCPYSDSGACGSFVAGNARDFFDARNWSPQGVPGSNDTATIGNFDVALDTTDDTKGSVVLGGLNLQGGNLHGASLTFSSGTGSDNLFNWSGGTLSIKTTGINATGTLNISGDGLKDLMDHGTINNAGTTTFSGVGQLRGIGSSTFNNLGGATFTLKNDGAVFTNYNGSNVFNNAPGATFKKQNDFDTPNSVSIFNTWTFNNSGAIVSNTGTLEFNNGEAMNFANGTTISGTGRTRLSGGTFSPAGTLAIQNTTFDMTGGALGGVGIVATANGATFNWTGGTINRLDVAATTALNLSGTNLKDIADHGIINNSGHTSLSGTGAFRGVGTSTFNNLSGAAFTLASDAALGNYNGNNVFNNALGATFEKSAGVDITPSSIEWAFNNNGLTKVSGGVLSLNAGGLDAGQFAIANPGVLRFSGGGHSLKTGVLLSGTGRTQLTGATVTAIGNAAAGTATSPAIFEQSGGLLTSASGATFTSYGTFNWTGGTIGGKFTMGARSAFNLLGTNLKDIGDHGVINSYGHTTLSGTGALRGIFTSTFNNLAGSIFTVASDADFSNYNGVNAFNNAVGATFEKTVGGTTTSSQINWAFNNSGLTRASQGVLALAGDTPSTDAGTFTAVAPGIVRFIGGTHSLKTGTLFNGTGKAQIAGATLSCAGNVAAGTSSVGTTFEVASGILTSISANSFTSYGTFNWTGGTIGGICNIAPNTAFNLSGTSLKDIGDHGVINSSGHTLLKDAGVLRGIGTSIFNNKSGATFTLASDTDFGNYNGNNAFNNQTGAIFEKTLGGATASSAIEWAFNNSGLTRVAQGVLALNAGGLDKSTFTTVSPGIVRFTGGTHTFYTGTLFNGSGKTQLTGATLAESGNVVAGSSTAKTIFEVSGGIIKGTAATSLTSYGTLNWTGGQIGGVLNITPNTALNLTGNNLKDIGDHGIVNNSGVSTWSGAGALRGLGTSTFNNLNGALFDIKNDGTPFGNYNGANVFNNQPGATLRKSAGSGICALSAWTFNLKGGPLSIVSGTMQSQSPIYISANTSVSGAGTLQLSNETNLASVLTSTSHVIKDGTLTGTPAAHYAGTGIFDWTNGAINGTLSLNAGTNIRVLGSSLKDIGDHGVINNSGTVTWSGGNIRGLGNSTINNAEGATFIDTSKASLVDYNGNNVFKNAGTFKTGAPVGKTTMSWSFIQSSTGIVPLDVLSSALTGFDQYSIGGSATLAGTLQIVRPSTFLPAVGTTFKFLTNGTRTGQFAAVQNIDIDATRKFEVFYNPSDVTLKVVSKTAGSPRQVQSEPSSPVDADTQPQEPMPAPSPTQEPSNSTSVSSASVSISDSSIKLAFTRSLDSTTATDLRHYSVSINGQIVELMGVSVRGNVVTLLVPESSLHDNDSIMVEWNGLKDSAHGLFAPGAWSNNQNPV